jgi:hypothetical protein
MRWLSGFHRAEQPPILHVYRVELGGIQGPAVVLAELGHSQIQSRLLGTGWGFVG